MNFTLVTLSLMGFTALFVALFLVPLMRRLSFVMGAIDHPGERRIHDRPVPRLGGLAIGASFLAALLLFLPMQKELTGFLVGALVVMATGLVDDIYGIKPWLKFFGEIIAASLFITISGAELTNFGDLFGIGDLKTGIFSSLITVFCIVGVINALNLSDGLDGLAGGLSSIACLFLALFAYKYGHSLCLAIIIALFASTLGFLRYNSFPSVIFMGDAGSLLLGYSLIAIAVLLIQEGPSFRTVPPISAAIILALPIIDTLLVMARRIWHGQSPFLPDRTHLHHRLLHLGLPHPAVVGILYSLMAGLGLLAWKVHAWPEYLQLAIALTLIFVIYGIVILLNRIHWQYAGVTVGMKDFAFRQTRLFRGIATIVGQMTPFFAMFLGSALFLPTVWPTLVLTRTEGLVGLAASLFTILLFPWFERRDRACGWMHGLLYVAAFVLLALFQLSPSVPVWLPEYFMMLAVVLTAFILLKVIFNSHNEIFLTSSFELMMISISWLIPLIIIPELGFDEEVRSILYNICLEAIPVLLTMKILIRKQPRRNYLLAGSFSAALLIFGIRGLTGI